MKRQLFIVASLCALGFGCGKGTVGNDNDGGGGAGGGGGTGPYAFPGGSALRFGVTSGTDALTSSDPPDPNVRTVAGWYRLRTSMVMENRQMTAWSLELPSPSTSYQMLNSAWHADKWEAEDSTQGGFLFAPVDLSWWFIAETNDAMGANGPATNLYFKKEGDPMLTPISGNKHPMLTGVTRLIVGSDDANGQNEWMDGDLAGLKIWDAALTQAELELESQKLSPVRTEQLHAFYPLQTVETMLQDISGNNRNLTQMHDTGMWSVQTGPAIPFK